MIPWEIYVQLGERDQLVKAGQEDNIGRAVAAVHTLLPDVEPTGVYAYGWVYIPAEREPMQGSHRPLRGNRLPGSRCVCWSRPGL